VFGFNNILFFVGGSEIILLVVHWSKFITWVLERFADELMVAISILEKKDEKIRF
jgi:hypothetical protein